MQLVGILFRWTPSPRVRVRKYMKGKGGTNMEKGRV